MTKQASIVIGTRGSPLALAQAEETKARLLAQHAHLADGDITLKVIQTSGDAIQDRALKELGGKGLFTKEIEEQLLCGDIDLAVHSMKDMPTVLPDRLEISCLLPREDPRDAFLSTVCEGFDDLPQGAVVGTSSLRRAAQALRKRPDLKIVPFRGNVGTRMRKLDEGQADATFLACAGLNRLVGTPFAADRPYFPIAVDTLMPAPAQGAIGIEIRSSDDKIRALLAPLNDADTAAVIAVERAFLAALDGSCQTPIAAHATLNGDKIEFCGEIISPDGKNQHGCEFTESLDAAAARAGEEGRKLRAAAGPGFFDAD